MAFTITASLSWTIAQLKEKIYTYCSIPAAEQRLIYAGRILQNESTLSACSFVSGQTVHLVKAASNRAQQEAAAVPSVPQSVAAGQQFPPGLQLGGSMEDMQAQLMANPQMMDQMMNSPMVQGMMSNPDMMRTMMMANPQVRALIERNPEIGQLLTDPEIMRQSMEMARNPALRQEMMRNQDRALSNLESMPGGFNALQRMYSDVQEPLMDAVQSAAEVPPPPSSANSNPFLSLLQPPGSAPAPQGPSSTPLPNPWARPPAAASPLSAAGMQARNPYASLFGGGAPAAPTPGSQPPNPFAGLFGSAPGGVPGLPPGLTPAALAEMMQAPGFRQSTQQLLADPAMMENIARSNPMLQNNPAAMAHFREMMANPQLMQQMLDPANMQAMMQMQQAMAQLSGAGLLGPGMNPQMPMAFNPQAPSPQGLGPSLAPPSPAAPQPAPAARFAVQLQKLQEMGFTNEAANLAALNASNGNIENAIMILLQ